MARIIRVPNLPSWAGSFMSCFRRLLLTLILLIIVAVCGCWEFLASSLPQTRGTLTLVGLDASVVVVRDDAGVPTIRAQTTNDLYLALGFVHAQDRLFQMDLQRRLAQGRLSQVFGREALDSDRTMR